MKACQGAVLLLLCATLGHAQVAPGDENSRCTDQLDPYPPSMMMLMNSRHYSALLGPDGVWDQMDLDDNDPETSFNPTYFEHNAGGICRWSVMSCGYRSGWQDNYLFTQFISKAAPPDTTHTVRVIVDILYTLSSCRTRYDCNPKFELLKFWTDGPQPREVFTDHTNYQSIRVRTGSSAVTQRLVENIDIPANIEGIYLAVRDNRSCIQVAQVQVYRYQCPRKQEGLVVFPDTAAPVNGNMTITAQCMPDSYPVTDMDILCHDTGYWSGSGRCRCYPGYYRHRGVEDDYCVPCRVGYYRSDSDPEDECILCPAFTEVDLEGAPSCNCLAGHFRNNEGLHNRCPASQIEEDVSYGCTWSPSAPLNLEPIGYTDSSLTISWEAPYDNGGRSDLYYQVHHSDPVIPGLMIEANCTRNEECLTDTVCTISGLQPATGYFVRVSAHNGVSDQDEGGALARMIDITLETDVAPPTAVKEIEAFCEVIVWEEPADTNGEILFYGLMFNYSNGTENVFHVSGDKCFFIISSFYEQNLTVQIFAINQAGPGPYASVDLPECPWVFPYPTPSPLPIPASPTRVPDPSTVYVTTTETVVSTETATLTTQIPIPTSVIVTVPTTVTTTATVTDEITTTATFVVTSTVVSTAVAPTPSPVVVEVPTTVTTTATTTTTETSHSTATATETVTTTATTTVVPEPSSVVVHVPTTVVTTATETDYITTTTTDTVTTTATTSIVIEPSPVVVSTTVTETATETDHVTATTTAVVTTCPAIPTPEPTQLPTCPEPAPCDSCCEECEECEPPSPPPPPCPICDDPTPPACPSCPTISFYSGSTNCARPNRKPGNVRNVRMLNCGMIVWDAPEEASCCKDNLTYKVRFFNGTSFKRTEEAHRKVTSIDTSWIKFTSSDLPAVRPLQVMVKARKQDGIHSAQWVNAGPLIDSYVVDCPPFN